MRMTIEEYGRRFPDRPEPVPAEYLGHWIAWNEDRTKIIAHGKTFSEVMRQAQAAECVAHYAEDPRWNIQECAMSSAKDTMTEIIARQPDDSSYDELLRELAFARMVQRGLEDSDVGRILGDDEIKRKIDSWRK